MTTTKRDVVVIGVGPAGATTAMLLAQRGIDVLVLEREHFPRAHLGESLLPACHVVQEVLGVTPTPDAFVHKRGARFVCEQRGLEAVFDFAQALPGPPRHAYHVDRPLFDCLLRDRARTAGAEVRHGVKVRGVEVDSDGVRVRTERGMETCRYVVDATGQDRLLGRQAKSVVPFQHFGKAASFTQWEGLSREAAQELAPDYDIRIMMIEQGWAWIIPLPGDRLSVGVTTRERGLRPEAVLEYARTSPLLKRWTRGLRAQPVRLVGNFSCRNQAASGCRFACVGDASCFIDPVFSSGVSLAIRSGMALVEQLAPALHEGREADPRLAWPAIEQLEPGYDTFASLVYRFYNTRFVDNFMFGAPEDGQLRSSVTSVLAGDVFRPDNPFRDMLRASRIKPWLKHSPSLSPELREEN